MSASNRESVAPANRDAALVDASLPPPDAGSPSSFSPPFPVFPPSEDELTAVKRQLDALQPKIDAAEKRRDELRAKGDPDWKLDNDEVKQLRTKEALLLKKEEQLRDELKRKEVQSEQTAAVADLSALPAAIAELTSVTSTLASHLRSERKVREAHLVLVRLWNLGIRAASSSSVSASASSSPSTIDPSSTLKLRASSYADLRDKVSVAFALNTIGRGATTMEQQLAHLQLSSSSPSAASPATSSSYSASESLFTLYYLLDPTRWWETRVRVDDEDSFEVFVSRPPYQRPTLLVWRAPNDCTLAEHHEVDDRLHQHSPLKDGAPPELFTSLALAGNPTTGMISPTKSTASSRSSAQQADFADAVRQRDDDKCVVCAAEQVEAAHVVPVKDTRTAEGKAAAHLLTLYDPRNGITLCTHCHDYFDAGLWCISPVDRCSIHVSDALAAHRPVWAARSKAQVRLPSHHTDVDNWPSKATLQVQVEFVTKRKQHRLEERRSYPHECRPCGSRFMTKSGWAHHQGYCTGRGHLKPSQFHTPQKSGKTDDYPMAASATPIIRQQHRSGRRRRPAESKFDQQVQEASASIAPAGLAGSLVPPPSGAVDSASSSRTPQAPSRASTRTRNRQLKTSVSESSR